MYGISARLALLAVSFFSIPLCCLAQKHNDFTKASGAYSERYNAQDSNFTGQKSQMQGSSVEKKSFVDSDKSSWLNGKSSSWTGQKSVINSSQLAPDASKMFKTPTLNGDYGKWRYADEKVNFFDSDNNLTKKYNGKIDVSKRNRQYQDFIDKYYGNLVDRSMEDFNKFYSRTSDKDNTYVKRAGAELTGEEEESFFDSLFSSNTKIERKAVKFTGVERRINPASTQKTSDSKAETTQTGNTQKGVDAMQAKPQVNQLKTKPASNTTEVIIDGEQAKKYNFLKAPDQYRSKATIKVQVKE